MKKLDQRNEEKQPRFTKEQIEEIKQDVISIQKSIEKAVTIDPEIQPEVFLLQEVAGILLEEIKSSEASYNLRKEISLMAHFLLLENLFVDLMSDEDENMDFDDEDFDEHTEEEGECCGGHCHTNGQEQIISSKSLKIMRFDDESK